MIARRRLLLGAALLATLAAAWWASRLEQDAPEPTAGAARSEAPRRTRPAAAAPIPAASLAVLEAPRPVLAEPPELFQPRSLQPPPPPPPTAKASKPQAPALPFRYIGALEEGGERAVFLLEGTQVRLVRAGDQIGSQYRVEKITPTSIEFTYLPLRERQILATARP